MKLLTTFSLLCSCSLMAQSYFVKGPANPKPYEATAIQELTDYLAKRIDGKLTIGGKSPVTFHVGDTELAKEHELLSSSLPEEEWHIKSVGDNVILNGGGTRGALYATYHFLEDFCGIHWWSDVEEHVPKASSLALDALDASGKPMFIYRDIYRTNSSRPVTAIRNRMNRCGDVSVPLSLGGSFTYGLPYHCHTFDSYVPAEQYLKDHPEYFSLVNGKRVGGQYAGQLCLTNPELKRIFLEKLLENIRKGDESAAAPSVAPRIFEVSMNDNWNRCQCDGCKAEEEKYNPSGLYLNFVNWLAGEVKKTHPHVFISTLAYFYTEEPPKGGVRAADNVVVKLCDTKTNEAASILEPENKVFYDFVKQWKGFSKHLFIWDYAITFTPNTNGIPFASEFHYGDVYRHYYENNVTGIFWEHEEPFKSDFYELKFFLETKLMEDPYQNVDGLIRTFMDCYYGAAAPYILEYRKAIDSDRKAAKGFVSWFPSLEAFSFIGDETILKSQALFDKAEAAVANDKRLSMRVRHARCGLDRLTCSRGTAVVHYRADAKGGAKKAGFDVAAAARRQLDAWPEWCRQFPNGEGAAEDARNSIASYAMLKSDCPVPEQLKDRNLFDYHAHFFDSHDREHIKPVEDAESPVGMAMRVEINASHYYNPPFAAGFYDQGTTTTILNTVLDVPKEPGYHLYHVGKAKIPENGYVFATRAWRIKLQTGRKELKGKEFGIWVSARFTGPKYIGDEKEKDYIYVDRILLVEPDAKKE